MVLLANNLQQDLHAKDKIGLDNPMFGAYLVLWTILQFLVDVKIAARCMFFGYSHIYMNTEISSSACKGFMIITYQNR